MSVWGQVAIAGVYEHPTRFAPDKTAYQLHAESARGALEDAGLGPGDVDGLFTSGVGPIGVLSLAGHLNLRPRYVDSQSIGGSSFVSHCVHAAAAIAGGLCEVALVTYAATAASESTPTAAAHSHAAARPGEALTAARGMTLSCSSGADVAQCVAASSTRRPLRSTFST